MNMNFVGKINNNNNYIIANQKCVNIMKLQDGNASHCNIGIVLIIIQ